MYGKRKIDTFYLESSRRRRMETYEYTRLFEERAKSTKVQTTKVKEANSAFYCCNTCTFLEFREPRRGKIGLYERTRPGDERTEAIIERKQQKSRL